MNDQEALVLFLFGMACGWMATLWYHRGPRGG